MKRSLSLLIMLLAFATPCLQAQTNLEARINFEPKLRKCSSVPGVDYTYISPWMLESMQNSELKELKDIPIGKVKHIEIVKTKTQGLANPFRNTVNDLANELNLVAYNREEGKGVKICIESEVTADEVSKQETEIIKRLLVIQWGDQGVQHTVFYIIGDFTSSDINSMLHF